jgi:hypothetical protein
VIGAMQASERSLRVMVGGLCPLRQNIRNGSFAKVERIVGVGGPLVGIGRQKGAGHGGDFSRMNAIFG